MTIRTTTIATTTGMVELVPVSLGVRSFGMEPGIITLEDIFMLPCEDSNSLIGAIVVATFPLSFVEDKAVVVVGSITCVLGVIAVISSVIDVILMLRGNISEVEIAIKGVDDIEGSVEDGIGSGEGGHVTVAMGMIKYQNNNMTALTTSFTY